MSGKAKYLIAYDIADPRRLGSVCRHLKKVAFHLQYSVFLANLADHEINALEGQLRMMINPREDDVRIYPLPQCPEWTWIGKPPLPEAAIYLDNGEFLPAPQERPMLVLYLKGESSRDKQEKCHSQKPKS